MTGLGGTDSLVTATWKCLPQVKVEKNSQCTTLEYTLRLRVAAWVKVVACSGGQQSVTKLVTAKDAYSHHLRQQTGLPGAVPWLKVLAGDVFVGSSVNCYSSNGC